MLVMQRIMNVISEAYQTSDALITNTPALKGGPTECIVLATD